MAFTIENRPFGFNRYAFFAPISSTEGSITSSNGDAIVSLNTNHNLITGDTVYIVSPVDTYNGFKYIEALSATQFYIKNSPNGDRISYIKTVVGPDFYFWEALDSPATPGVHGWNCVHLPIKYEISNTLWPLNTEDTIRTISTASNSNGYTALTLSGDIKNTGSAAALEFIKITNSGGGGAFPAYDGVYQITAYTNDTTFSISLAYDNTVDLSITGASIQYYYNNYHLKVRIHGGLIGYHFYAAQKPDAILATIDLTPDSDGLCVFSVNEILKTKVSTKNNLLLGTLPNNIDSLTNYYIEVAEVYDDSDGVTLSVLTPTYTSDLGNINGFAVNAKLPFKNVHSGSLSEYVGTDSDPTPAASNRKFLTLFNSPTIFSGKYFDISFISTYYQNFINPPLNTFVNDGSGDLGWTLGSAPTINLSGANLISDNLYKDLSAVARVKAGITYRIALEISTTTAGGLSLFAGFLDSNLSVVVSDSEAYSGTIYIFEVVGTNACKNIFFRAEESGGGGNTTILDYWVYPINDTLYFNEIFLKQGGIHISVSNYDEGVYRQKLTDPSCLSSETTVTLYRREFAFLALPVNWSNFSAPTAFDLKGFDSFSEAVTTVSISPVIAYTTLTTSTGEVVRISIPIVVTGTATFTTGIRVNTYLSDGAGVPTSAIPQQTITANGSYTLSAELTATAVGARIYLQLIRDGISAGQADVVITIPETITIEKTEAISETKTLKIDCECYNQDRYLSWMNPVGGFDYWNFPGKKDRGIDILATGEARKNLFPTWPQSGGEFADSDNIQTHRTSKKTERVRSQQLTESQVEAISYIKTSPLVTIVNSIYDRRVVIIDSDSFVVLKEIEKLYTIEFNITYTDEIPSQTL